MDLADVIIRADDACQSSRWVLEGKTVDGILTIQSINCINIVMAFVKKAMSDGQFKVEVPKEYMKLMAVRKEIASLGYKIEEISGAYRVSWDDHQTNINHE